MDIKGAFVRRVLQEEGETMLERQERAISTRLHRRSGTLLRGRRLTVSGGDGLDGQLDFKHPVYERFLDMKRLGKNGRKRKGKRIHNRFVFGAYSSIAKQLMYGFTEEVARDIREKWDEK
ncbi:MAG: hypothetical protein IKT59_09055 [Bacteroidales bacterium]|nr:hypothetical protein [Bacteroidales bacterium]